MKTLITGSEGTIGRILKENLREHNLVLLDQEKGDGVVQADICDLHEIFPYFKNIETVIHLAADVRNYINWISLINPNLTGTRNVYEAAVRNKVKRIIYASSLNVYPWQEIFDSKEKISEETPTTSANDYGLLKLLSEEIGRDYHKKYKISVVNLRLGSVNENDKPCNFPNSQPIDYSHWLSKRDIAGIIKASLNYNGFVNIPCSSANKNGLVDLSFLEKQLGFIPQDSAEQFEGDNI
ncbi:MAG: NAD(P)-dependent oxidoreductase [Nanoarchaeota archaeon]